MTRAAARGPKGPDRPSWRARFLGLPVTGPGRWALALALAFWVFFGLWHLLLSVGQRGGETFFSNPYLAASLMAALGSAIAGGAMAGFGILVRRERSALVFLALLFGAFWLVFALGEIGGHGSH